MEEIRSTICETIKRVFEIADDFDIELTPAPELEGNGSDFRADLATNVAMRLAGKLHKNPREVAETLRTELLNAFSDKMPVRIEIAGPGFMNFMLPDEYFKEVLAKFTTGFDKNISCDEYSGKEVVTEFSDPNPFKVLHIGHLYTSIMGESISRLIEYAGGKVHRVNFGGDVGLHVAKTLYSLNFSKEFTIEDIAQAYVEGTRAYEEDEEAKNKIVALNKQIYEIAEKDLHDSDLANAYWKGRELSYKYFDDFYDRIGVKFERYYPESTVARKGLMTVREHIPVVYQESDGAIVFRGEDYGLHTRVFINKEGLPTYETKDVGLLFTKNDDYHFDESVVITGNDIVDYMKVVLRSIEQYAPELVEKTQHITHGNVRLPGNEKMSSRKGNFIKAVDILNEVEQRVNSNSMLALGAIKYSLLRYRIGGDIIFDIDESVSMTGNSGLYLQYSAVRANKILSNLAGAEHEMNINWKLNAYEIKICKKLVQYGDVLRDAVRGKAPHIVCNYLFELAQEFSRFYEECKVAGDEFEQERKKIVQSFANVMTHGLNILGIDVPESM
ncbi:arginine--tRNA ligase [Candidatus Saccharibacteria bacterium]|nr:arginine--tRNA ligase [Candidatus Saccharibacteria bacterium]